MGLRRKGRELALAVLYQWDLLGKDWKSLFQKTAKNFFPYPKKSVDFAWKLVEGVVLNRDFIDSFIEKYALNWPIDRMNVVDRNIMRIGIFEMLYFAETPPRVAIDEAIELSKKYSEGEKSGDFVNAILDKVYRECGHERE